MLDIVIVNWNSGVQLQDAITSIAKFGVRRVNKLIVVDNNSSDDSLMMVEANGTDLPFPLRIIRNLANLGFGAACNQGASQADSEFLLFLNPDTVLFEDTLSKALTYMQDPANTRVGICGVQLLDVQTRISRSCSQFPSARRFIAQAMGLDRVFPKLGHFMTEWDHRETREVDQVMGAFFLVRRAVFVALGGFDERFFVYFEEVDFSRRARDRGWRSVYLASAQIFHAGGGTSRQVKARRLFYSLRSRLLYAFKHFSWAGAMPVMFATLLVEPISRSVLALLHSSWSGLNETWAAYGMLWRWLPQWLFKGVTR
jgi:GT2 family glycosyltransferase